MYNLAISICKHMWKQESETLEMKFLKIITNRIVELKTITLQIQHKVYINQIISTYNEVVYNSIKLKQTHNEIKMIWQYN